MDHKDKLYADIWGKSSPCADELPKDIILGNSSITNFGSQQHQQKWQDHSFVGYNVRAEPSLQDFNKVSGVQSSPPCYVDNRDVQMNESVPTIVIQDWDPRATLNNLSFLEQKIHQLQDLVHLIVGGQGQASGQPDEIVARQQQLITADLTSIIAQLISTAGSLLPSAKQAPTADSSAIGQLGQVGGVLPSGAAMNGGLQPKQSGATKVPDYTHHVEVHCKGGSEQNHAVEDHESKEEEDVEEGENLLPGTYEILQLEKEEILAPHTHFCTICGKGFKRDANLRMHMRGHGDEYKTAAALAKPQKESISETKLIRRYSCPYVGCKRNKEHKKFQPLKTILCVKNHYKRTHCDKSFTCSRCHTKKFSVIADLKTHEKHCGRDKWLCSCGTTFSRKDKLFGHIALFQGHTPAISLDDNKSTAGPSERVESNETTDKSGSINFCFGSNASTGGGMQNFVDPRGTTDDPPSYFSPINFDTCNFGGFNEFPRPPFDDSDSSFSFLFPGSCNYPQKKGPESSPIDL